MYKMLDVNLEDISTVEEDVQREQEALEMMMKVIQTGSLEGKEGAKVSPVKEATQDGSMEEKQGVKDSPAKVCSDLHISESRPSPNQIQTPRTRSKADVGANKASPGRPSEREKRDKVTKKDIMEGHQKPLNI
ncbi:hypothetical protein KI387_042082, partial [Taxus chinensis]